MLFNSYDFLLVFFFASFPFFLLSYLKNTWQHNCIRESLEMIKGNFHPTAKGETKKISISWH